MANKRKRENKDTKILAKNASQKFNLFLDEFDEEEVEEQNSSQDLNVDEDLTCFEDSEDLWADFANDEELEKVAEKAKKEETRKQYLKKEGCKEAILIPIFSITSPLSCIAHSNFSVTPLSCIALSKKFLKL